MRVVDNCLVLLVVVVVVVVLVGVSCWSCCCWCDKVATKTPNPNTYNITNPKTTTRHDTQNRMRGGTVVVVDPVVVAILVIVE